MNTFRSESEFRVKDFLVQMKKEKRAFKSVKSRKLKKKIFEKVEVAIFKKLELTCKCYFFLWLNNIPLCVFLLCVCVFRAAPAAYGGSQARHQIRAAAADLHHSSWQSQILNPLREARD